MQIGVYEWTLLSRREDSEVLRHQSISAHRYCSTSRTIHKRGPTCFHFRGAEAQSLHYARLGQVSFDERSYKLATPAVESFGRLGKKGRDPIDQVATSIV